jgi:hypothetical protein
MNTLEKLDAKARDQRQQFEKTLHEVKTRTTLPALTNHALSLIDWRGKIYPVVAVSAVAGASALINKFLRPKRAKSIRQSKTKPTNKEINHES